MSTSDRIVRLLGKNRLGYAPYDAVAAQYDSSQANARCKAEAAELRPLLCRLLIPRYATERQRRVLDVGCGTGFLLDQVPLSAYQYVGIDPSYEMLQLARQKWPGYPFRQTAMEDLEGVCECCCEVAVCLRAFNYCSLERTALMTIRRVLVRHGKILLLAYNGRRRHPCKPIWPAGVAEPVRFAYSKQSLVTLLSDIFVKVSVQAFSSVLLDRIPLRAPRWVWRIAMVLDRLVCRVRPGLACYLIATGEKE